MDTYSHIMTPEEARAHRAKARQMSNVINFLSGMCFATSIGLIGLCSFVIYNGGSVSCLISSMP